MIIRRVTSVYETQGLTGVIRAVVRRLKRYRAKCYPTCRDIVFRGAGIEIGGPSYIFATGGLLPLYGVAARIDNCNFSSHTIFDNDKSGTHWSGEGSPAHAQPSVSIVGRPAGREFIAEGSNLNMIANESYDFVLASHMLEHAANPLATLAEWRRILKPGGGLVLVLPHRDGTFDHHRPVTTLGHLLQDLENNIAEDDATHFEEVLQLHDLSLDIGVADVAAFRERVERNSEIRGVHHHVFDARLAIAMLERSDLVLEAVELLKPHHIIVVGRKLSGNAPRSRVEKEEIDRALRESPFPSDRK